MHAYKSVFMAFDNIGNRCNVYRNKERKWRIHTNAKVTQIYAICTLYNYIRTMMIGLSVLGNGVFVSEFDAFIVFISHEQCVRSHANTHNTVRAFWPSRWNAYFFLMTHMFVLSNINVEGWGACLVFLKLKIPFQCIRFRHTNTAVTAPIEK